MTKLHNVIGGLEYEKVKYDLYDEGEACYVNGYNQLCNREVEVDGDGIWELLAEALGCKPNKEDCNSERCSKWGRCEQLFWNISKAISQGKVLKITKEA